MAPDEVGQNGFVLSRQDILQCTLKCVTVDELNAKFFAEKYEIAPRPRVAFDELTDKFADASYRLADSDAPLALTNFDLFV